MLILLARVSPGANRGGESFFLSYGLFLDHLITFSWAVQDTQPGLFNSSRSKVERKSGLGLQGGRTNISTYLKYHVVSDMDEQGGQRMRGRDQGGWGSRSIARPVTPLCNPITPPSVKACALSCQRVSVVVLWSPTTEQAWNHWEIWPSTFLSLSLQLQGVWLLERSQFPPLIMTSSCLNRLKM